MFSKFFIQRPIFATVISIFTILAGAFGLLQLPVERYPDISPPTINVTAIYPGANAQTVATRVGGPIEQQVNGVEGMIYMSSVSSNDGRYSLTVTFENGADLDAATVLVQNRVAIAQPGLPEEVKRLGVSTRKKSPQSVLYLSFFSPDGTYGEEFLSNYVELRIKDELARVEGVGDVQVFGTGAFSMRVWLDPDRLRALDLTTGQVLAAIRAQNQQVAAGKVGATPTPVGVESEFVVKVEGELVEVEEFESIVVKTAADGRLVRLRDLARVELGAESYDFTARFNGKPAAAIAIYQIPGSNLIEVASGVKSKLAELSEAFPVGMESAVVYDNTDIVIASIEEVVVTLFITVVLVILTVYLFLQNVRATLIPSVTIPVSLIGTFAVMYALGFSINQFSLFGLVLVIGIVVDDAIIVVENCTVWLEKGLSPKEAATKAMEEVGGPVIATTCVLLSVFVPCLLIPGIKGTLFGQFAVTISIATLFSSINALTLSPALCGILLRKNKPARGFFKGFESALQSANGVNAKIVRLGIKGAFVVFVLFIAASVAALFGLGKLPTSFVPQEDEGYCMVIIQLPDNASMNRMNASLAKVEAIAGGTEGVRSVLAVGGFSPLDGAAATNTAFCLLVFDPWDERQTPELAQQALVDQINRKLSSIEEATAFAIITPSLPGVGLSGGFTYMLQDRAGVGLVELQRMASEIIADGNAQSHLEGLKTTFRGDVPQLLVDIDRERVQRAGASLDEVFATIGANFGKAYVNDFSLFDRTFKVNAQAEPESRATPDDLDRLQVRTASGKLMPLGAFASVEPTFGPQTVTRFNMYPSIKILGGAAPGVSSGEAIELMEDLSAEKLPDTMGFAWTDLSYQEKAAASGTAIIFVLAILMVYLVLSAQYESWSIPLSVIMSVPAALLGGIVAAYGRGIDNNVYTQIGIVLLIGLATKSAILISEFAKAERESGKSVYDAAVSAATLRFRPVLMTAFSFILGVLPLVVASGAGAVSRQVLGTVVLGGMVIGTALSLSIVPVFYYILQSTIERFTKRDG